MRKRVTRCKCVTTCNDPILTRLPVTHFSVDTHQLDKPQQTSHTTYAWFLCRVKIRYTQFGGSCMHHNFSLHKIQPFSFSFRCTSVVLIPCCFDLWPLLTAGCSVSLSESLNDMTGTRADRLVICAILSLKQSKHARYVAVQIWHSLPPHDLQQVSSLRAWRRRTDVTLTWSETARLGAAPCVVGAPRAWPCAGDVARGGRRPRPCHRRRSQTATHAQCAHAMYQCTRTHIRPLASRPTFLSSACSTIAYVKIRMFNQCLLILVLL